MSKKEDHTCPLAYASVDGPTCEAFPNIHTCPAGFCGTYTPKNCPHLKKFGKEFRLPECSFAYSGPNGAECDGFNTHHRCPAGYFQQYNPGTCPDKPTRKYKPETCAKKGDVMLPKYRKFEINCPWEASDGVMQWRCAESWTDLFFAFFKGKDIRRCVK